MPQYEQTNRLRMGRSSWFFMLLSLIVMALAIAGLSAGSMTAYLSGAFVSLGLGIVAAWARTSGQGIPLTEAETVESSFPYDHPFGRRHDHDESSHRHQP